MHAKKGGSVHVNLSTVLRSHDKKGVILVRVHDMYTKTVLYSPVSTGTGTRLTYREHISISGGPGTQASAAPAHVQVYDAFRPQVLLQLQYHAIKLSLGRYIAPTTAA